MTELVEGDARNEGDDGGAEEYGKHGDAVREKIKVGDEQAAGLLSILAHNPETSYGATIY
jgi:hypothetical protein